MKLLIAVTSPLSYLLVKGQGRFLRNQGVEVFFVSEDDGQIGSKVGEEHMTFEPIRISRNISLGSDFKALCAAIKLLYKVRPDIVNASTPKAGLIFMIASVFSPRTIRIFTLRGLRSDTLTGFKKTVIRLTEKLSCGIAQKVIVISPSLRDHAVAHNIVSKSKTVVFGKGSSNGVDINRFARNEENETKGRELRNRYGIPSGGVVFGFVGRLVKDKGVVETVKAFLKLSKQLPKIYLVIAGKFENDDSLPDEIVSHMTASNNIYLLGHQTDVPALMTIFDVLVLASYREGFGNVAIEASSMELPVIVSNIPGVRDTIEEHQTGLLVPPRDVNALSAAMKKYALDRELRVEHGLRGRQRVEKYFSSLIIWKEQLKLYKKLISE